MTFDLNSIKKETILRAPRILVLGVEKIGKALDYNTPIFTNRGWQPLKFIKRGDYVFDRDGSMVRVTDVTGIMEKRTCYEVKFKSGASLIADKEHQWLTRSIRDNKERVLTTGQILKTLRPPNGDRYNHAVPITLPLKIKKTSVIGIDPYVLGVWLGDGSSSDGRVTISDRDALIGNNLGSTGKPYQTAGCKTSTILGLKVKLRNRNLLGNKHIPHASVWESTEEDRRSLLAGLMDTDGCCYDNNKGQCEFSTVKECLCDGFIELLRSLGVKASITRCRAKLNGKDCGPNFRVAFFPKENPFRFSKFKFNCFKTKNSRRKANKDAIVSVTPVKSVPVKCISVDSPSHTYLAGRDLVVTHNTTFSCGTQFKDNKIFKTGLNAPILLSMKGEEGADDLEIPKFPVCNKFEDIIEALGSLYSEEHEHRTVVLDSASAMEPLVWNAVCDAANVKNIEAVGGGYGKGYTESVNYWRQITEGLDALRSHKGMSSIIIGHVKVKRFDDPSGDSYDQYILDINEKAVNMLFRWADVILFCNTKVKVQKEDKGFGQEKKRGIDVTGGSRFLFTQKRPAHPGGGRGPYGRLPYELPLDWNEFMKALTKVVK